MKAPEPLGPPVRLKASWGTVAALAGALLAHEVSLMRLLLVASWHHFAFLVISLALLGLGASGTLLTLARGWLLPRAAGALFTFTLAAGLGIVLSFSLAQELGVEARFVPALLGRQLALWLLYWMLLALPFLLGGAALGLALSATSGRAAPLYGANLLGSGAGAALAPAVMEGLPPEWLPACWAAACLTAAGIAPWRGWRLRWSLVAASAVALGLGLFIAPPRVRVDPFKYGAHVERLVRQGEAARIARVSSARGVTEVYRSAAFHDLPFLASGEAPPPLDALVIDGHWAGSLLHAGSPEAARVVERTLMAFPYALAPRRPRVLLLGERSGSNVWLAALQGARETVAVQLDEDLFTLIRGRSAAEGGGVLDLRGVRAVAAEPRGYLEQTGGGFDLIQLVTLEGSAAGAGGMAGLGQDHLATVQAFQTCLRKLGPLGLLAICRGIQTPPRDNLKLLATLIQALRLEGLRDPQAHLVVARDYLAVCTVARRSPFRPEEIQPLRRVLLERELTPVWFPGVEPSELNRPDEISGPPGEPGDWYHHAVRKLCSAEAERFIEGWAFNIRPATDDRPFFHDFCKLGSIGLLRQAFGELWLTRAELGFLFVLAALGLAAVFGGAATVLPLVLWRGLRGVPAKGAAAFFFTAIGLGYLLIEMAVLAKVTLLLGDPVTAAAFTISAFLVFSGCGSMAAARLRLLEPRPLWRVAALIAVAAAAVLLVLERASVATGSPGSPLGWGAALLATAPLAFLLGMPMPAALARLERGAPALIPWAWGVNGFASVVAAPLATALAMTWGFRAAGAAAAGLYLLAGWAFARVPG